MTSGSLSTPVLPYFFSFLTLSLSRPSLSFQCLLFILSQCSFYTFILVPFGRLCLLLFAGAVLQDDGKLLLIPYIIIRLVAQGTVADMVGQIFGIRTGFQGTMVSNLAKLNFNSVTEVVNEKHLEPWTAMCTEVRIGWARLGRKVWSRFWL